MSDWHRFYDIMLANGMDPGTFDVWHAPFAENGELWPIQREGEMVGGVAFLGHTIHIAVLPEWHGRWATTAMARALRSWAHPVPIVALIQPDNRPSINLARRVGFEFTADQGAYHLYTRQPPEAAHEHA